MWRREFERHAPGSFDVVVLDKGDGARKAKRAEEALALARVSRRRLVVVLNHEACWRDPLAKVLSRVRWSALIVDECHRLKAPDGRASKAAFQLGKLAKRRLLLTGTPAPHSPLDLYAQFRILDQSVFGWSFSAFRARYGAIKMVPGAARFWNRMPIVGVVNRAGSDTRSAEAWAAVFRRASDENREIDAYMRKVGMWGWLATHSRPIPQAEVYNWLRQKVWLTAPDFSDPTAWPNAGELREKFRGLAFEVSAEACLDLPPVTETMVPVQLGREAMRVHDELSDDLYSAVDDGFVTAANALSRLLRMQQATSGFAKLDDTDELRELDDAKVKALADLLADVPADRPVVVFARFSHDLDRIAEVAAGLGREYGEVSGRRKDLTPHSTMPDHVRLMGVQLQAGGVGIDLTAASIAVYYSANYSLGDHDQSKARLHRPGQARHVHFLHLVAEGTIDGTVYSALSQRRDVVEYVLHEKPPARARAA